MTTKKDFVSEVIGDWGPWQLRTVLLIYLCKIPSAWFMACIIFTAPIPKPGEYYCFNQDANIQTTTNENLTYRTFTPVAVQKNSHLIDFCTTFNYTYDEAKIKNSSFDRGEENIRRVPCTSFQFNTTFETTVTKFSLVCSRTILIATSQFFHLFGVLTGGILATKLMETISPRNLMLHGMVTQLFVGCLIGLVSNYEIHMLLRYIAAICCAQMYTAGQVIFTDITGGTYRTMSICLFENLWSIGVILLPVIAFIDPNWSSIFLMISLPTALYIPLWWLIPDTPRWFLRKGQVDAAVEIIENAISVNNTTHLVRSELRQRLSNHLEIFSKESPPAKWHSLWTDRQTVMKIIAVHIAWAVYVTNYNGMLLNVKAFGREYLSLNTVVLGISEIIGVFIGLFLILKTTHKWKYAGTFNVFAGLFASFGYLYPSSLSPDTKVGLLMLTAIIPKIAVSCSQSILFSCTAELVKPEKRKALLFSCIVWARIWLLTAPYIGALLDIHQVFPLSVFGMLSAIGGVATFTISTPRTVDKISPATVMESATELPSAWVPGKIFTIEKHC